MISPIYTSVCAIDVEIKKKLKLVSSEGDLSLFAFHRTATLSASVVSIFER